MAEEPIVVRLTVQPETVREAAQPALVQVLGRDALDAAKRELRRRAHQARFDS